MSEDAEARLWRLTDEKLALHRQIAQHQHIADIAEEAIERLEEQLQVVDRSLARFTLVPLPRFQEDT